RIAAGPTTRMRNSCASEFRPRTVSSGAPFAARRGRTKAVVIVVVEIRTQRAARAVDHLSGGRKLPFNLGIESTGTAEEMESVHIESLNQPVTSTQSGS